MENKEIKTKKYIRVPICLDCKKPHYGRRDKNDRCLCDTHGNSEYGFITKEPSTPKEIIEEFDKKFPVRLYSPKLEADSKHERKMLRVDDKVKSFFISKMISEYEEMLRKVEKMKKSDKGIIEIKFGDGTLAKREIDSDMVMGYNKALSDISLLIQSKLKAWRDLRDNK